ncbi:MAG: endonuclease/exonuclease/phosphatase family protein [Pseudomonadota bacterium]
MKLKVMSFNAWGAGANEAKSIDDTVAVLSQLDADIIGLQEHRILCPRYPGFDTSTLGPGRAQALAHELGYHVYLQDQVHEALWANAILSRYPILSAAANDLGVVIQIEEQRVGVFNIHPADAPYQPYQALGVDYSGWPRLEDEQTLIDAAQQARGFAMDRLLVEIAATPNLDAVFVTADLNEPSHLDWTERAAELDRHPLKVAFPTTQKFEYAGFVDAYRHLFPDEVTHPGFTWSPKLREEDALGHPDRIDYVFVKGDDTTIDSVMVAGEASPHADISFDGWPSDHRAVLATVAL